MTTKERIEDLEQEMKLQEQYVEKLEKDRDKLIEIINILCDTISQLI